MYQAPRAYFINGSVIAFIIKSIVSIVSRCVSTGIILVIKKSYYFEVDVIKKTLEFNEPTSNMKGEGTSSMKQFPQEKIASNIVFSSEKEKKFRFLCASALANNWGKNKKLRCHI